jgi:hypothetical protein
MLQRTHGDDLFAWDEAGLPAQHELHLGAWRTAVLLKLGPGEECDHGVPECLGRVEQRAGGTLGAFSSRVGEELVGGGLRVNGLVVHLSLVSHGLKLLPRAG